MSNISKLIIAIVAVSMVVSCCLIPVANAEDSVAAETEVKGFQFALEQLVEGSKDGNVMSFGNVELIPVQTSSAETTSLPSMITERVEIGSGVSKSLASGTTTFSGNGQIVICKDGTLVLVPLMSVFIGGMSYTIVNDRGSNGSEPTSTCPEKELIVAENGAKISILNRVFVVSFNEDQKETETVLELSNGSTSSGYYSVNGAAFRFSIYFDNSTSDAVVSLNVEQGSGTSIEGNYTHVRFMDAFGLEYNAYKNTDAKGNVNDFELNATLSMSNNDIIVNGKLAFDIRVDDSTFVSGNATLYNVSTKIPNNSVSNDPFSGTISIVANVMELNERKTSLEITSTRDVVIDLEKSTSVCDKLLRNSLSGTPSGLSTVKGVALYGVSTTGDAVNAVTTTTADQSLYSDDPTTSVSNNGGNNSTIAILVGLVLAIVLLCALLAQFCGRKNDEAA